MLHLLLQKLEILGHCFAGISANEVRCAVVAHSVSYYNP